MDEVILSSTDEEEEYENNEEDGPDPELSSSAQDDPASIDWREVIFHFNHCTSARNACRRRRRHRCREESRRLHPYRFADSDDEDFTETADEGLQCSPLHRTCAGTGYCS